jgi:hypothetical protein
MKTLEVNEATGLDDLASSSGCIGEIWEFVSKKWSAFAKTWEARHTG